jgi:hypothetical protein
MGSGAISLPKRTSIVRNQVESEIAQTLPHFAVQSRKTGLLQVN